MIEAFLILDVLPPPEFIVAGGLIILIGIAILLLALGLILFFFVRWMRKRRAIKK